MYKNITARQNPPIDDHLLEYKFPTVREKRFGNGLTVLVIERREIPQVYFRLAMDFGEKRDPQGQKGAVELLARLLKKGTPNRSYRDIVEEVDFTGGVLDTAFSQDFFYGYGAFLKEHFDNGMGLLAAIILNPLFPPDEIIKEKANMVADLENEKSSPAILCYRQMEKTLFTPHPYSLHKSTESLQNITRKTLQDLHRQHVTPCNNFLVIAGDVTFEEAVDKAEKYFAAWQPENTARVLFLPLEERREWNIYLINRPHSEQVTILLGNRIFSLNHPEYEKALVTNKILGGGASSRLFLTLREEKGYTYGASSSLSLYKESGNWICSADVRPEVIDKAIEIFYEEFEKIASIPVSPVELKNAKRYLTGSFPLKNETAVSAAELALRQKLYGLPENFGEQHLIKIDAVTAEDVQETARRYLQKDALSMVLVGDATKIEKMISQFGNVEVLPVD